MQGKHKKRRERMDAKDITITTAALLLAKELISLTRELLKWLTDR